MRNLSTILLCVGYTAAAGIIKSRDEYARDVNHSVFLLSFPFLFLPLSRSPRKPSDNDRPGE